MTNEELNTQIAELGQDPDKTKVSTFLQNIGSLDGFDAESLDKLDGLMKSLGSDRPANLDSLASKITELRQQLQQSTAESPTAETPTAESPTAETPETEIAPDELDKLTSHDLWHIHEGTGSNYDELVNIAEKVQDISPEDREALNHRIDFLAREMKMIENYAEKQLQEIELSYEDPDTGERKLLECNAPIIKDYVEIMKAANPDYKYKNEAELKAALIEYDRVNDLADEKKLPSAEKVLENAKKWEELAPKDYDAQDFVKHDTLKLLKKIDKDVYSDMLETLRVATITELAKEEPEDEKKAKKRFKDKYNDIATHYFAMGISALNQIKLDPKQQEDWWKDYCRAKGLPLDKLDTFKADKEHVEAYNNYVISSVYKTLACTYTQTNAVYASRLAQKTGMPITLPIASQHNKTMWEKYPQVMTAVKKSGKIVAVKSGATILFGGIGATAAQIWQTTNDFKAEIAKCKEANGGKVSVKSFAQYLKKNPEAAVRLARGTLMTATVGAAAAAICLSGGAALGVVGTIAGVAVTNAAAGVAIRGVKAITATAISTIAGGATYLITRKALKPKKQELMELLEKYLPAEQQEQQKKGLLARFQKGNKTQAQQKYNELTKLWKNGDEKLSAKIAELNIPLQEKTKIMQLAKDIKGLKMKGWAVAGSSVLGAVGTAIFMDMNSHAGTSGSGGGATGNWDLNKSTPENLEANKFVSDFDKNNTVEQIPLKPGEHLPEQPVDTTEKPAFRVPYQPGMEPDEMSGELHNLSLSSEDFEKITNGPNTIIALQNMMEHPDDFKNLGIDVEKIQEIGLDFKKLGIDFDEMRGSGSHVKTTAMINHLNNLQLSDADQEKLHQIINTDAFKKVNDLLNGEDENGNKLENRMYLHEGGRITVSRQNISHNLSHNHTGNGGAGGNAIPSIKPAPIQLPSESLTNNPTLNGNVASIKLPQTVEATGRAKTSGLFSFLHKKQDFNVSIPVTGDLNKDVENYAYGVALKQQLAKAGVADVNHPTAEQTAAARAVLAQKGYHITGKITDAAGQEHSFKVVKHADGSLKRIVDGQKMKLNEDGVSTFNRKVKLPANTVGESNSEIMDRLLARIKTQTASGETVVVSAVRDGETKQDYLLQAHQNGQVEIKQHDKAVEAVKAMGKAGRDR